MLQEANRATESSSPQSLYLSQLHPGTILDIQTRYHAYRIEYLGHGAARISGHPEFCPKPRLVNILGSSSGGSILKANFLGQGMQLEFQVPGSSEVGVSSPIERIRIRYGGNQSLVERARDWLGRKRP